MPKKSFCEYVRNRPVTDDPEGDFVSDARRDRRFPEALRSWSELQGYLNVHSACPEAIVAARTVWREYERSAS
jgi:uncharacterized protein YozE (UPF0346 family)